MQQAASGSRDRAPAQQPPSALEQVRLTQSWYETGSGGHLRLRRLALELVSERPANVRHVCEALVKALAEGMKKERKMGDGEVVWERDPRGECIKMGDTVWDTRLELKARCQDILRRYPEEGRLEEADLVFMRHLLAHHPRGQEKLMGCEGMVAGVHPVHKARCFYVIRANGREDFSYVRCIDNAPTEEIAAQRHICDALCQILQLHSASCEHVAQFIEENFPSYRGREGVVEKHRNWTNSILELCTRMPALTEFLLRVLVRRMLEIDATISKMEGHMGADERLGGGQPQEGGVDEQKQSQINAMAHILDAKMMMLFEFLQRHLAGAVGDNENFLVSAFLQIFESTVLLTPQSRCVQFLWFYMVSLRPAWAEAFLSLLLRTSFSANQGMNKRLMALAYLASFIARAKFLTKNFTLRTTQYVSTLAREHLQLAESHVTAGAWQHPQLVLFLYAVQCMCYVLCFHAADFGTPEPNESPRRTALQLLMHEGSAELAAEAFAPVLESPANPIARINRQVAEQFCRCLKSQSPVLVGMLRQRLQEAAKAKTSFCQGDYAGLEMFFPFDPYRLRHSAMFVLSIYRDWSDDADSNIDPGEGFARARLTPARARSNSMGSEDDDARSDLDFTDARDAAERGFIPSIGPSPAFLPRGSTDMADIMSPLCMPMSSTTEDDDGFALPTATVPLDGGSGSMLFNLINTAAFHEGRA